MAEQRSPTSYELPDGEYVFSAIERWLNQWLEDIEEAFERWMSDRESPVNSLSRLDSLLGAPVRILMIESRTNGHSKLADAVELAFGKLRYAAEKLDRFAVEDGPFFYSGDVNRGTDWIFGGDGEALGFSPLGEQGLMKSVESFGAAVYEIQLSTTANKLPISGSVAATDRKHGFN